MVVGRKEYNAYRNILEDEIDKIRIGKEIEQREREEAAMRKVNCSPRIWTQDHIVQVD